MSYEIARQIIARRTARNKQRIQGAVQTAYNEALQEYKSVAEARKAAIEVLEQQRKELNKYQKILSTARENVRKGEIDIAKRGFEIDAKNSELEATRQYRDELKKIVDKPSLDQEKKAREHAQNVTQHYDQQEASKVTDVFKELEDRYGRTDSDNLPNIEKVTSLFKANPSINISSLIKNYETQASKKGFEPLLKKNKKDIKIASFRNSLKEQAEKALGNNPGNLKLVNEYIDSHFSPEIKNITTEDINRAYNEEYNAKLSLLKPKEKPKPPDRYLKKPKAKRFTAKEKRLAVEAEPIFEMLRKTDDSPFELTDVEMAQIARDASLGRAYKAYQILQKMIPNAPQLVTREEELLLDKLALERQLDIYKTEQKIGKMQPHMKSRESINRRALEIADPKRSKNQELAKLTPQAQKFYATQKQALELSDKSDSDLLNGSIGEKTGVLLYKKHFDPINQTYRNGSNYDAVLSDITNEFPDAESQLQAIASFNSRAMSLQRSSNPIILPDGKEDKFYQKALKSFLK